MSTQLTIDDITSPPWEQPSLPPVSVPVYQLVNVFSKHWMLSFAEHVDYNGWFWYLHIETNTTRNSELLHPSVLKSSICTHAVIHIHVQYGVIPKISNFDDQRNQWGDEGTTAEAIFTCPTSCHTTASLIKHIPNTPKQFCGAAKGNASSKHQFSGERC